MNLTIPPPLETGDKVAVISPSFGAVGRWPHRTERGLAYLRSIGLEPALMDHAARNDSWVSASAEERAADIHQAFSDPRVGLVLCGIGGNHSNQVIPHLDFELIRANPKWFQGYSDVTVLHWALMKRAKLAVMYGPALTLEPAEYPRVLPYTDRWLQAAWFRGEPLDYEPALEWTQELLDFDTKADLTRPREMQPSEGWVTINAGRAEGIILGGCLETICWHLKGQADWIVPQGVIFFFETSEESPPPEHVDSYLTDLEQLGVFETCTGLLVGRPRGYSVADRHTLWEVVGDYARRAGIPALGNVDCSHTDPMLTLPMGVAATLDATTPSLTVHL